MKCKELEHTHVPDSYHIVTLHRGIDKELFLQELKEDGIGVVKRHVDCPDEQPRSTRNITVDIDDAERDELLADARVMNVQAVNYVETIRFFPTAVQNINPVLSQFNNNGHDNWALDFCTERNGSKYTYSQTGRGVDIVIVDSGVHGAHAEFKDDSGNSRLRKINWEPNQFTTRPMQYVDEGGHGTAVASCAAGRTQGFARDARIYSIKIFDTDAYTPLRALQNVRTWHENKVGTADEGRPTVVNNSWVYSRDYPTNHPTQSGKSHGVQVASIDAEIESMIDAGIILVAAAGNEGHYIASKYDPRYNDYYYVDNEGQYTQYAAEARYAQYQNRYSPSGSDTIICVGANGNHYPADKFHRANFSNFGSRINLFAPGTSIQTAVTNTANGLAKISGTSFSSPITSGIVSQYLETYPEANQGQVLSFLDRQGDRGIITGRLTSTNNLSVVSIFNSIKIRANGIWKPLAYAMEKRDGRWSRTKNISMKQNSVVHSIFGRTRN